MVWPPSAVFVCARRALSAVLVVYTHSSMIHTRSGCVVRVTFTAPNKNVVSAFDTCDTFDTCATPFAWFFSRRAS